LCRIINKLSVTKICGCKIMACTWRAIMIKGKIKEKSNNLLSIILVPHSLGKVKVLRVTSIKTKLASLFLLVVTVFTCLGIYITHITNENQALKEANSLLQSLNAEQYELISEKADEIRALKIRENNIDTKVKEFADKYRELVDNYISSRSGGSSIDRSGDRSVRSFTTDVAELKEILKSLSELDDSDEGGLIDLSETEKKLQQYLDSIPTLWPTSGRISSGFGERRDPVNGRRKFHEGLDIAASYGAPIMAAADGTVTLAKLYGNYGRTVIIDHGQGISTLYAHASSLLVK